MDEVLEVGEQRAARVLSAALVLVRCRQVLLRSKAVHRPHGQALPQPVRKVALLCGAGVDASATAAATTTAASGVGGAVIGTAAAVAGDGGTATAAGNIRRARRCGQCRRCLTTAVAAGVLVEQKRQRGLQEVRVGAALVRGQHHVSRQAAVAGCGLVHDPAGDVQQVALVWLMFVCC